MFESHDSAISQTSGTAEDTSLYLSDFVMNTIKESGSSFKPDLRTSNTQETANSNDSQFLEFGPIPGVVALKPGEIPPSPIVREQLEAELRLNAITPPGDSEFDALSRDLNHAFVSGDLSEFQRVLQSTNDLDMRNSLVDKLDARLDALEQGLPNETQMYANGNSMEFFPEDEQRVYGFTMDLNTNETNAILADVTKVNVNGNWYPAMVPVLDENKQPVQVDTDTAKLFQTLTQNEVRSIASSNEPLGTIEPIER